MALDPETIRAAFAQAVNMSAREIAAWLESDESRSVGWVRPGESESVGRASGKLVVAILKKRGRGLSEDDLRHMRKVVGFIRRHRAQRPYGDISRTRWRYALMNWGCDPVKDEPI